MSKRYEDIFRYAMTRDRKGKEEREGRRKGKREGVGREGGTTT